MHWITSFEKTSLNLLNVDAMEFGYLFKSRENHLKSKSDLLTGKFVDVELKISKKGQRYQHSIGEC